MKPALLLALVLAVGAAACHKDPIDQTQGGTFVASLQTQGTDDGAILIRVIGQVGTLTGLGSHRVSSVSAGGLTRVVVSGDLRGGDLFEFTVDDVDKLANYVVVVEQVAANGSFALLDPTGRTVTLRQK